jgi:hypothetical protein
MDSGMGQNMGMANVPMQQQQVVYQDNKMGGDMSQMGGVPMTFAMEVPAMLPVPVINLPTMTSEQAKQHLEKYVGTKTCYGSAPAKECAITKVDSYASFHSEVVSYVEARKVAPASIPYDNTAVDGPQNGMPPGMWEMLATIPAPFTESTIDIRVPHTETVLKCQPCGGDGRTQCTQCNGQRQVNCSSCGGRGTRTASQQQGGGQITCNSCNGSGKTRCGRCNATGQITCGHCQGKGSLRHFQKLTVQWKNLRKSGVVSTTAFGQSLGAEQAKRIPEKKIAAASGQEVLAWEDMMINTGALPQNFPPDATQMVRNYFQQQNTEIIQAANRLLRQRVKMKCIPVFEVAYTWKDKPWMFYCFGLDPVSVHESDYPVNCCGCCHM